MSLPPSYNLLEKYPNRILIETGSYRGDAIQAALDAGFSEVRSIDIDPENTKFCKYRFDLIPRPDQKPAPLKLWTGDSAVMLWDMIKDINEPITFWLDAHSQLFEDEPPSAHPFPLIMELDQIERHPIRTHTIIIDDILMMTHPDVTGWTKDGIEFLIWRINNAYKFKYVANPVKNNLLIATV
jgi:hypothetical protein